MQRQTGSMSSGHQGSGGGHPPRESGGRRNAPTSTRISDKHSDPSHRSGYSTSTYRDSPPSDYSEAMVPYGGHQAPSSRPSGRLLDLYGDNKPRGTSSRSSREPYIHWSMDKPGRAITGDELMHRGRFADREEPEQGGYEDYY